MPYASSLAAGAVAGNIADTVAADSMAEVAETVAANTAIWVATEVDTACLVAEYVAIVVAVAHVVDIEAIPALDLAGTRPAVALIVVAMVVAALADCPSSSPLNSM